MIFIRRPVFKRAKSGEGTERIQNRHWRKGRLPTWTVTVLQEPAAAPSCAASFDLTPRTPGSPPSPRRNCRTKNQLHPDVARAQTHACLSGPPRNSGRVEYHSRQNDGRSTAPCPARRRQISLQPTRALIFPQFSFEQKASITSRRPQATLRVGMWPGGKR